ncbi:Protein Y57G11C.42 c [Aphelenchoides avenae]|nr:Protein Y57G11C.42 c [Aphelenchus avenae]
MPRPNGGLFGSLVPPPPQPPPSAKKPVPEVDSGFAPPPGIILPPPDVPEAGGTPVPLGGGPSNTSPPPSRLTFGPELATQPPAFTFPTLLPEGPNVGSNSGGFGGGAPPPDPPPFPQGQGQGRSRPSTEPRFKSEPEREVRVKNKNGAVDGESRLGEREKATLGKSGALLPPNSAVHGGIGDLIELGGAEDGGQETETSPQVPDGGVPSGIGSFGGGAPPPDPPPFPLEGQGRPATGNVPSIPPPASSAPVPAVNPSPQASTEPSPDYLEAVGSEPEKPDASKNSFPVTSEKEVEDKVFSSSSEPAAPKGGWWTPLKFNVHKSEDVITPDPGTQERTTLPEDGPSFRFRIQPSGYNGRAEVRDEVHKHKDLPIPPDDSNRLLGPIRVVSTTKAPVTLAPPRTEPLLVNRSGGIFNEQKIGVFIDEFFSKKAIQELSQIVGNRATNPSPKPVPSVNRTGPLMGIAGTTKAPNGQALIPPRQHRGPQVGVASMISNATCGVAPDFKPCVPVKAASERLLHCCKSKLLPAGCHDLCRYDVTQAEIKKAFDSGKCGILSVAPFLQCASDGHNNLECCRHRGIAGRSGPQCEVFCNPSGGLGALGLQHIACQHVIGDLLQCHHSGLRN